MISSCVFISSHIAHSSNKIVELSFGLIDWLIKTNKISWDILANHHITLPHPLNMVNDKTIHLNKSLKLLINILFFKKTQMPGK